MRIETKGLNLHQLKKVCGDDERFAWGCVHAAQIDSGVRLTVTDGHSMVQRDLPADDRFDTELPSSVLIHPDAFKGNPDSIEISDRVVARKAGMETISLLQDGRYPPTDKIRKESLGKKYQVEIEFNPRILIDALTALGMKREEHIVMYASNKGVVVFESPDGVAFVMPLVRDDSLSRTPGA